MKIKLGNNTRDEFIQRGCFTVVLAIWDIKRIPNVRNIYIALTGASGTITERLWFEFGKYSRIRQAIILGTNT